MQADKVSMEYLLREKLEKLVQSEIDGRLRSSGSAGGLPAIGASSARANASCTNIEVIPTSYSSISPQPSSSRPQPLVVKLATIGVSQGLLPRLPWGGVPLFSKDKELPGVHSVGRTQHQWKIF